jgi:RNA polymerase sigma-70 factor (ECF subfamily)
MREEISQIFTRNYKNSLRAAYRILRSSEDAEDAVQNAYCSAFRHLKEFRGESSIETWITRIVVNCSLMELRKRRSVPQLALDNVLATAQSRTPTPEAICYLAELVSAHARATSTLAKPLYDVYAETLASDTTATTVADRLGLTVPTAKSRLFRARNKVKYALQPLVRRRAA